MTNPPPPDIQYEFDAAREHVSLNFGGAALRLAADEVERLAQFLGFLRASMSPEVSVDVPEGDSYPHMDTPKLVVQTTQDGRRAALGVRTPAFGWIAFLLDRSQAAGLGSHLTSLASTMSVRAD